MKVKVFSCDKHDQCTIAKTVQLVMCCARCTDYEASPEIMQRVQRS